MPLSGSGCRVKASLSSSEAAKRSWLSGIPLLIPPLFSLFHILEIQKGLAETIQNIGMALSETEFI